MTAHRRRRLMLADDGIIDLLAVEIAVRGLRTVALTRAERQLAAAAILARGGTAYVISKGCTSAAPPPSRSPPGAG